MKIYRISNSEYLHIQTGKVNIRATLPSTKCVYGTLYFYTTNIKLILMTDSLFNLEEQDYYNKIITNFIKRELR